MNKFAIVATLAVFTLAAGAPAFAATDTIFDHSGAYVQQDIAAQGFNVTGGEEWGELIVATVVDDEGHSSVKFFDPDTIALVR
ncbi:hypothetical protein [Devosia marina]|uniref:PepSY domain-containing protein n=1 Tax=Devosia marina TaxID=2683198 RepID=A0A7X3FSU7_9HYPH|nr:hypothetical protein [Devosia marina]MVT00001.1 hypothetical protein [Devosia marina]